MARHTCPRSFFHERDDGGVGRTEPFGTSLFLLFVPCRLIDHGSLVSPVPCCTLVGAGPLDSDLHGAHNGPTLCAGCGVWVVGRERELDLSRRNRDGGGLDDLHGRMRLAHDQGTPQHPYV